MNLKNDFLLIFYITTLTIFLYANSEECVPSIYPTFGPTGTWITFQKFTCFNSTDFSSFIIDENTELKLTSSSDTSICSRRKFVPILKSDGSYFNNTYNWAVNTGASPQNYSAWLCNSNDCRSIKESQFQLTVLPSIDQSIAIITKKSIISGGILQTFTGSNFNSVANPYMDVFACNSNGIYGIIVPSFLFVPMLSKPEVANPKALCSVGSNGTKMDCFVPNLSVYEEIKDRLNSGIFFFYMRPSFQNYSTSEFFRLQVVKDPNLQSWNPQAKDYPVNERPHAFIISGSFLLDGSDIDDYKVTVGGVYTTIVAVYSNSISFTPPNPEPGPSYSDLNGAKEVKVFVGNIGNVVGYIQYNPKSQDWIVGVACGGAALLVLAIIVVCCVYHHRRRKLGSRGDGGPFTENDYIPGDGIMRYIPLPSVLDSKKISFSDLEIGQKLSTGNYGQVLLAIFKSDRTTVAVKTALEKSNFVDSNQIKDIYAEATVMKDIDHPNVMNLIGICLDERNIPYLVIPYMANGDLKKYLKRQEEIFTFEDLLRFALDVLRGMEYLTTKKIIHRDLAARNCMVSETRLIKVSDFGLSRLTAGDEKEYYRPTRNDTELPVKWIAIECFDEQRRKFTEKTDVWSFGVLMWEILTRGSQPYSDVMASEIYKYIKNGNRLNNPDVEEEIYDLFMWRCWIENADERPTFSDLRSAMERKLSIEESSYLRPVM